jgi:hypothetical protein
LCRCLRELLRMRRSADLVFGIKATGLRFRAGNRSETTGFVNGLFCNRAPLARAKVCFRNSQK